MGQGQLTGEIRELEPDVRREMVAILSEEGVRKAP